MNIIKSEMKENIMKITWRQIGQCRRNEFLEIYNLPTY